MALFDCGLFENILTNIYSGMCRKAVRGAVGLGFGTEVILMKILIEQSFNMKFPRNFFFLSVI